MLSIYSLFFLFFTNYIYVDTLNVYIFKKVFDKGDSLLLGIKISPYIMVFKKTEEGFSGGISIDFNAELMNGKKSFVRFIKRIDFETYEETREKEKKIDFEKWIVLKEKVKNVHIVLKDINSGKRWEYKRKFILQKNFEPGDPIFFKETDDKKKFIIPPLKDTLISILLTFYAETNGKAKFQIFENKKIYTEEEFEFRQGLNKKTFIINPPEFEEKIGFKITYIMNNKTYRYHKEFFIKPVDIFTVYEWEDLLNAMNIIFQRRELEKLYKAKKEERKKLWKEFWKKYDSDPTTPHNETEIEFLKRFQYVMKNFSGPLKGYRTDRGRIYLKYGPPDFIEDHPYEWGTYPYQIWYYNKYGLKFLFVDKTGFGDYELETDIREIYPQY